MSEPQRVGSGTFKVDRARALELLARYRLESPLHFPLAWLRAAVAAGAKAIDFEDSDAAFTLAFDGAPYSAEELEGLLATLPEEGSEPRLQELARGAAAAIPVAKAVTVLSGAGPDRRSFRASVDGESVDKIDESGTRTIVAAQWPAAGRPHAFDSVMEALILRAFPGILWERGGRLIGRLSSGFWQRFEQEGVRGWVAPARLGSPSELLLHQLGVACSRETVELPGKPQVRAAADSAALRLDLSRGSCLRDERYDETLAKVGRAAEGFALDALRRLSRTMPQLGEWLRDPVAYVRWRDVQHVADDPGLDGVFLDAQRYFALDAGTAAERLDDLERWAPIVAWLRETALRVLAAERRPASELERALWTAPLYLTLDGLTMSVEELERQRVRFARVTVGNRPNSEDAPLPAAVDVRDRREMLDLLLRSAGDRLNP
ncbi:MAG: hypothetical protein HY925_10395 [Elusimicrobia bacterium]|nr:hypothetical protein [Elusimicrobiota bacterium]